MIRTKPFCVSGQDAQFGDVRPANHFLAWGVMDVGRVQQREQDVDIQKRPHQ
jgi:hypothetical protein